MFTPAPSEEQLAAAGLTAADFEGDVVDVWPENQSAYFLFAQLQTQWRVGAAGAIGLDYNTLFHKMDRMELDREEYDALEDDIRAMEFAALEAMKKKE